MEVGVNQAPAVLRDEISDTATTAVLSSSTNGWPGEFNGPAFANMRATITDGTNYEIVLVTANDGAGNVTIQRAVEPTNNGVQTAFGFAAGSTITPVVTAAGIYAVVGFTPQSGAGDPINTNPTTPRFSGDLYQDTSGSSGLWTSDGETSANWIPLGNLGAGNIFGLVYSPTGSGSDTDVSVFGRGATGAGGLYAGNQKASISAGMYDDSPAVTVELNADGTQLWAWVEDGGLKLPNGIGIYDADTAADLVASPLVAPAFGFTGDGTIQFSSGSGWNQIAP